MENRIRRVAAYSLLFGVMREDGELDVEDKTRCWEREIKLMYTCKLKKIVIGNNCFNSVTTFCLNGLNELESVVIGEKCFILSTKDFWTFPMDGYINPMSNKAQGSAFSITNCSKLKRIVIDDESFSGYHSFEMKNLPQLESIHFEMRVFQFARSVRFEGKNSNR